MLQQPRRKTGCLGIGCGGILGLILLLAVIGAATNKGNATATPKAVAIASSTSVPTATSGAALSASAPAFGQNTPQPNNATPILTVSPTPAPTPAPQVITVKENAVNVRQAADPNSPIIGSLDAGSDAAVLSDDSTGTDGATRWVHVQAGDKDGYVRSDLVSEHHEVAASTPASVSITAAPLLAITSSPYIQLSTVRATTVTTSGASGGTTAAAVSSWYVKNGAIFTILQSDSSAIEIASSNQNLPAMNLACQRLGTDVRGAMKLDTIPDPTVARHFDAMLRYMSAGSQDCVAGVSNLDTVRLQRAVTEFNLATDEIKMMNDAIARIPR